MLRTSSVSLVLLAMCSAAHATCAIATVPCSNNSSSYTERNIGGSQSTMRSGQSFSTTNQNLGGVWREDFGGGGVGTPSENRDNQQQSDQPQLDSPNR